MVISKRDEGFTLVEILVVIFILSILVSIAIVIFLNQRGNAQDASVKSDLNNVAKRLEQHRSDYNRYPNGMAATADEDNMRTVFTSPGNVAEVTWKENDGVTDAPDGENAKAYTICGYNVQSGQVYLYSSVAGGLDPSPIGDTSGGLCGAGMITIAN